MTGNTSFCIRREDVSNLGDKNFVVISLYIPVALAALIANIMVIVVVLKFHYMRNITNYFLVNLSVADLLVTIVCMPNGALNAYSLVWNYDEIFCKLINYLQCISVASSVFTITIMAVDRYLAITQPFGFCRWFTRKSTIIIIVVIWIASMIIFLPLLIVRVVQVEDIHSCNGEIIPMGFCIEDWKPIRNILTRKWFGITSFIIMFAFPGIIILLAYSMMGKKLCSMRPPFDDNSISTQQSYRLVRERKRVAWILLMLVFLFALCWLPYNITFLLIDIDYLESLGIENTSIYQQYTLLLGHANSALNPIIYCIMSKNFRQSVAQIICRTRTDFDNRRNHRLQWADTSGSSQRLCLQKMNTAQPIHIQLHMTLSRLQSSQKTTKTCAV